MSEKLSDRLRCIARYDAPWDPRKGCAEAADALDAKDAEIERLREALRPLAAIDVKNSTGGFAFDPWSDDRVVFGIGSERTITAGDLRRARTALEARLKPP